MPLLLRLLLLVLLLAAAPTASAQQSEAVTEGAEGAVTAACGTQPVAIARMRWPSAALLAEIHARILSRQFDCEVRMLQGDLAASGSSMSATGQPAVAPEMWIARIAEIWNAAIKAQTVRQAGSSYAEPVLEGWFVPEYAVAAWPGITTLEGLREQAPAFRPGERPRFISCPVDWACSVINRNLLRATGLAELFEVVEPANRFELDTLIAEAVSRREPILFYYWQPNAILAQFAFESVQLGAYDRDAFLCLGRRGCAAPTPTSFAPEPVVTAVAEWVFLDLPEVASYLQRATMPLAEMNSMLEQLNATGATIESVADRFIAERSAIWRPWVGLDSGTGG